jgi:hypothetical protein
MRPLFGKTGKRGYYYGIAPKANNASNVPKASPVAKCLILILATYEILVLISFLIRIETDVPVPQNPQKRAFTELAWAHFGQIKRGAYPQLTQTPFASRLALSHLGQFKFPIKNP